MCTTQTSTKPDDLLIGEDGDYLPLKGLKSWWRVFCIETAKLWRIAGPIAFQLICQAGIYTVTNMFVGHLGDIQLSAFSITISVICTFSFGFLLGMGSALETLCGQAFGAGQVHMLGVYMQRSIIILFVTCILLLPIYIFTTPILKLIGQKDNIANQAGQYTLFVIPQMFSLAISFPAQKFLQAQSKVAVLALTSFLVLVSQAFLCWLFIRVFGWGVAGAAAALDLSSWIMALAQFIYVVGWCKEGWKGLSWYAFRDLWAFVTLSFKSAIMLCLEVWYLMSIIILAGHLDNAVITIGSLSICMSISGWEYYAFMGVNAAISVRVGNELGLGRPRATKYCVYVTVFQSLVIGIICMTIVLATRNYLGIIYTNSDAMIRAVARLSILLGITMLVNSVQLVISGVAIGGGWQALVAYINLASYYIFGLPLGCVLAYVAKFGVMGLWGGMIGGVCVQTLLLLLAIYKTNWKKEVEQTSERLRKWGGEDVFEKSRSDQLPLENGIP